MLKRLLALVASHKTALSEDLIARELGVPRPLVSSMLNTLVDLGYLASVEPACAVGGCGSCRKCPAGGLGELPHLWTLTDKGQAALAGSPNHLT